MPTGHDAPWRGRRMTRISWAKYCRRTGPKTEVLRLRQQFLLQLNIAEGLTVLVTFGRQFVVIVGRGQLNRF
ncbi:Uncharacterised protein [Klebsiella grimontii]|uniref:Uncharacterized protein n=1 Tax=Klebsiella grimontii TaxID=2058152 RepID=A0A7H4P2V9_9ENTR|nr:Uncharacterised protein [Klebsiella grimontii]